MRVNEYKEGRRNINAAKPESDQLLQGSVCDNAEQGYSGEPHERDGQASDPD